MFDLSHDHSGHILIDLELPLQVFNGILIEEDPWLAIYHQVLSSQHSYP